MSFNAADGPTTYDCGLGGSKLLTSRQQLRALELWARTTLESWAINSGNIHQIQGGRGLGWTPAGVWIGTSFTFSTGLDWFMEIEQIP